MGYDEELKIRLPGELRDRWQELCEQRRIAQSVAMRELIEWVLTLEPEHQAMLMGQLPGRSDLATMLLRRMAAKRRR